MKRFVKIKEIVPARTGKSQSTGKDWVMTDLVVAWQERSANGEYYEQSLVVTISSYVNEPLIHAAMEQGKEFELTYYAEAVKPSDRWFNRFRGYLNREYLANVETPMTF